METATNATSCPSARIVEEVSRESPIAAGSPVVVIVWVATVTFALLYALASIVPGTKGTFHPAPECESNHFILKNKK